MQEPTMYNQVKPQFPEHEQLKCPRCDSTNTKFCYYNNYNLSQPRHFCKNCRRYWTKGGALRNIPVGGGSRKNSKRSSNSKRQANSAPDSELPRIRKQPDSSTASAAVSASTTAAPLGVQNSLADPDPSRLYGLSADVTGSFSSLLSSNGQFGNLLEGLNTNGSGLKTVQMGGFGGNTDAGRDLIPGLGQESGLEGGNNGESYLGGGGGEQTGDSSCWGGGGNGWPDLAIYTPGSSLQ